MDEQAIRHGGYVAATGETERWMSLAKAACAALVLGLALGAGGLAGVHDPPPPPPGALDIGPRTAIRAHAILHPGRPPAVDPGSDWIGTTGGLAPVSEVARFDFAIPREARTRERVALWLVLREPLATAVTVRYTPDGGASWREVWRGPADQRFVSLGAGVSTDPDPRVAIEARRASGHAGRIDPVVEAVDVLDGAHQLPDVPGLLAAPVLVLMLGFLAMRLRWRLHWAILLALGMALARACALVTWPPERGTAWIVAGLALACWAVRARERSIRSERAAALVTAAVYAALVQRWGLLADAARFGAEPDVLEYVRLARDLGSPFDTGHREPLWIWLIAAIGPLFSGALAPRVLSIACSLGLLVAIHRLGARLFGPRTAVAAVLAMASADWLAWNSVRGYRFEATALLGTVLALACMVEKRTTRTDLAAGALAGALLLVRLACAPFTLVLLALAWWRGGRTLLRLVPLVLLPAVLVAPHLVHAAREFANPFEAIDRHARYYRNFEFAGTPGYPSREEVEREAYGGPPVSFGAYLFGMHSVGQLARSQLDGTVELLWGTMAERQYYRDGRLRQLLACIGLALWVLNARRWGLVAILVLAWGPAPAMLVNAIKLDPRLVYLPAPLLELACAHALVMFAGGEEPTGPRGPA